MRILIVVHGYPPTHNGGAERRAERTVRSMVARGHDVRVVCGESVTESHTDIRWEDQIQDGALVRRLFFNPSEHPDAFQMSYDNPQTAAVVEDVLREWQPDILHLFSGYLMSASVVRVARKHNVAVVVSLTDYWWLCHRINLIRTNGTRCSGPTPIDCTRCYAESYRRYRLPARAFPQGSDVFWWAADTFPILGERLGMRTQIQRLKTLIQTLRSADALIAPSQYLANFYIRYGIDPARIRVWRQGVQIDHCLLRTPDSSLRFGFIGQMKHHKGVHLLLDAWSRLQGHQSRRLTLYGSDMGEDTYGQRLRQAIQQLDNVTWAGQFRGAEVWRVLAELDVLVMPSRWVENSPNSILEAQAVGIPIVGTNLGGIAELVQHEQNGLLFEVDNADDLARQMQRLLHEPDLLQRLRHTEVPFRTVDDEMDQINTLYAELTQPVDSYSVAMQPAIHTTASVLDQS